MRVDYGRVSVPYCSLDVHRFSQKSDIKQTDVHALSDYSDKILTKRRTGKMVLRTASLFYPPVLGGARSAGGGGVASSRPPSFIKSERIFAIKTDRVIRFLMACFRSFSFR